MIIAYFISNPQFKIWNIFISHSTRLCFIKRTDFPSKKKGKKSCSTETTRDGSEMRKSTGTGAAGFGKGKVLTLMSSATRRVTTRMLCSYSLLKWPLADSHGECVRAFSVIPFSIRVAYVKMHTILVASTVTWFALAPLLKISLRRAAIKPLKFRR